MSKPTDEELRARLTPEQYQITQQKGTERAFTGKYAHNKDKGVYTCVCCGSELFSSDTQYDSGSGWPSFWLPLAGERVRVTTDRSHAMVRRASSRAEQADQGQSQSRQSCAAGPSSRAREVTEQATSEQETSRAAHARAAITRAER